MRRAWARREWDYFWPSTSGTYARNPAKTSSLCSKNGFPFVEGIDLGHVLVGQREIEQVDVLSDVRRRLRSRNDDVSLLDVPTQQYLGGGLAVLLGEFLDEGFGMIESLPRPPSGYHACSAMLCSARSALSSVCGK